MSLTKNRAATTLSCIRLCASSSCLVVNGKPTHRPYPAVSDALCNWLSSFTTSSGAGSSVVRHTRRPA